MKKNLSKLIAVIGSACIALSCFTVSAATAIPSDYDPWGTSALGPGYPNMVASFSFSSTGGEAVCNEKTFEFSVKVEDTNIPLYLCFPSTGGIRLHNDNPGYYEPKKTEKIKYTSSADNKLKMDAGTGTYVVFDSKNSKFSLSIYNDSDTKLFTITEEQISFGFTRGKLSKVKLELPLAKGESIYGTGERFNELEQVGRRLLMWNVDCGYHGNSKQAELWRGYKNVPILHSNRGYTLFYNSYYSASIDIGYTNPLKYTIEYQAPQFDIYIWTGTPKENLSDYTELTGTTVVLPKWAYSYSAGGGAKVWREVSMYGKAVEIMEKYAELGTPNIAAVYVEDINSDDANTYNVFKKTGTRVLKWNSPDLPLDTVKQILPGVATANLPRVKMLNSPTQDSGNFFDFTDILSSTALKNYLAKEISWGMRGGLLDFGELIQAKTLFRGINKEGYEMHNFFPYWYAKAYYTAMYEALGKNDFVFFSRSGSAGTQSYTAFFTGDQQASFEGLRQQLSAGLSASSSGLTTWGGDIAGYGGKPTNTVFARGMQFATFQPVMRSHGTTSRFPWDYGNASVATYQQHYWLRENLLNKIYSSAINSNITGSPITTPLTMEYPDDASLDGVYETYLFCDDLLVTPVLSDTAYTYNVTFPKGTWYSLWNGEKVVGGGVKQAEAPIDKSPVYVKAGSVIPLTLSDKLVLTDSMQDTEAAEALMITVPDSNRTTTYYKSTEESVEYSNTIVNNNVFRVTAGKGNDATAIIVKGVAAYSVKVDGKKLERLSNAPTASGKVGFYSQDNGETVINIGNKNWKEVDISLGKIDMPNLLLNAAANDSDFISAIDGDWGTSYQFSTSNNAEDIIITLKEETALSKLLVKWTYMYATDYKLEISSDGITWESAAEVTGGYGGIETHLLNGKKVKYLRISDVIGADGKGALLYEIEAYAVSGQLTEVNGSLGNLSDGKYIDGPGVLVTEDQIIYIPGTESEYIKYTTTYIYFPTWAIVLICIGSALLIGGGIFLIIFLKKKRKKKAEASEIPIIEESSSPQE